jgi:hypothetical protein
MTDRHNDRQDDRATDQTRQPADVIRDGSLKATIWRNEGGDGPFYSTSLARTFEDREGNLRDAHSFSGSDLLKVSELARKAYDRSAELRREEFKQERQAERAQTKTRSRDR